MYSLFLFLSLLSFVLLLRALDRGTWKSWALWGSAILLAVASHPYGALVLAAQGVFVLAAHRERLRQAVIAFAAVAVVGMPFWLTDLVLAGRFDVGVGGHGAKLGGPWAIVTYLWQTAGDFSTGRWPALVVVLVLALVGLVTVRSEARVLALCVIGVPVAAFLAARFGGSTSPESRHLIFVLPFFAILVGAGMLRATRRLPAAAIVADRRARDPRGQLGLAPHAAALRVGAEQAAGDARPGGALPRGDEPARRSPLRLRAALPRRLGAQPLVPRRRPPARRRGAGPARRSSANRSRSAAASGSSMPASGTTSSRASRWRTAIPGPPGLFETRVYGPFLILRTREPVRTEDAYLTAAARAMLVGRSLGIGDADVNMQTIELADRSLRGYGPSLRLRSDTSR